MFIYNVFIYLPCINTQWITTAPFKITTVISYSDHQTPRLYQGSDDRCEGDHNSNIIRLFQPYQKIHYCNQSLLAIVPDLKIFAFSITIVDLISRSALVRLCLLCAIYLYNSTGLRFYIFGSLPASCLRDRHFHGWVQCIDTTKIRL